MDKLCLPVCAGMLFFVAALPVASAQTPGEIILYAGTGTAGSTGNGGPATSAEFYYPVGIALDKSGNLYIADSSNNCVRKVNAATGIITDVAGLCQANYGYSGDGGLAVNARLTLPYDVAFDGAGNMYIADSGNEVIRKVDASTGVITTVAGDGNAGDTGDGGPATSASLNSPTSIAVDSSGNIYVSDDSAGVVRKVTVSTGIITRVAGTGTQGYIGDGGPALVAELSHPFGLAFDSAGNLYIADQLGSIIRKVSASTGIISTVVGSGATSPGPGDNIGDGGPARNAYLSYVREIAFDRFDNLYIADEGNFRVRKVTASTQIITSVAGNGNVGQTPTPGQALQVSLYNPWGIAVDNSDNFYISDVQNMQVYKVFASALTQSITSLQAPYDVLAGQSFGITVHVTGSQGLSAPTGTVTFYNNGSELTREPLSSSGTATYSLSLPAGTYTLTATYSGDQTYFPSANNRSVVVVTQTAAAPQFAPPAGTYDHNLQVSIYTSTPGMAIVYTTDGTTPSSTHGIHYTGAVPVTANTTIKAIATTLIYPPQALDSPVASASYVINLPYEAPLPQGEWGWQSGGPASAGGDGGCRYTGGNLGVYGTLNVAAPNNVPGGRSPAAHWIDKNGNLWVFGGPTATGDSTKVNVESCNVTNDLWMLNPTTKEWTWMSGSSVPATVVGGVYGTLGKFAPANVPGSRGSSVSWTDKSGNLWLFGGQGYDSNTKFGSLNDLWEFNPSTRQWAWIAGSKIVNQGGSYGTLHRAATGNIPGSRWGSTAWTDSNGNFWMFGGFAYDSSGKEGDINDLWEFNPSTRQWAWMGGGHLINQPGVYGTFHLPSPNNIPGARDSGVAWVDKFGKFWFFGGEGLGATSHFGAFNDLWEFNPSDLNWTWAMGSAYGGTYGPGNPGPGQGGVYDQLGVPDSGNTPGSRLGSATFTDAEGNLWLSGGIGYDSAGNFTDLDDLWEFDRAKWLWAWMGGHAVMQGALGGATYGPYRVSSSQTQPGPRSGAVGWTDKSGNFWLFGGARSPAAPSVTLLNDLFEYRLP